MAKQTVALQKVNHTGVHRHQKRDAKYDSSCAPTIERVALLPLHARESTCDDQVEIRDRVNESATPRRTTMTASVISRPMLLLFIVVIVLSSYIFLSPPRCCPNVIFDDRDVAPPDRNFISLKRKRFPSNAPVAAASFTKLSLFANDTGMRRRLPNGLIIGVRKAGTRAVLEFLKKHPRIRGAAREVHYFDRDDRYRRGLQWYAKQMPLSRPGDIVLEKSPAYFFAPRAPARVFAYNSSVKLILVVRDPISRLVSDYWQLRTKKGATDGDIAPLEELLVDNNGINTAYKPLRRSLYAKSTARWLKYFRLSQIHFVDGNAFQVEPYDELMKIVDFLGVRRSLVHRNAFYFNETKGYFCSNRKLRNGCLVDSKGHTHPPLDPTIRKQLTDFLRPHNERFFTLIGRRFPW